MSDIENVMRYFNINQVEIERYYEEIYMQRRKDMMRKRYTRQKKDARIKNGTH